jgi:hypothetical protein
MKIYLITIIFSILLLSACKQTADPNPTYNGVSQTLGNGKVFSWMKFKGDVPSSIGLTFTKGALENIPHGSSTSLIIALPTEAIGKTAFDHLFLDFSHSGHEPPGIYDVAHFDVHFMMQANAERSAIPPYSPTTATKFDNLPADGIMPKPYFRLPAGVPLMGVHWANPTSAELNGSKFSETLIMGSYDGKMTFIEPMITMELMQSKPNVSKSIPTPSKFAKATYFPMKYSIQQVGEEQTVSLDELMMMQ